MSSEQIPWADIVARCEEVGVLAKKLYVVFTSPTGDLDAIMENLEEHLAFQHDLEQRGIMFAAGPLADDDEKFWEGEGMVIIRADSLDEARKIADSDPMHERGIRRYRVRPWLLNEGSFTVRITYSDGGREIS